MTTAAIIQARMTSTRLPGKVLEDLAGQSVLRHVLDRCRLIPGVDIVCCAVPEGDAHEAVAGEAAACGAQVVRGSETDVLDRYHAAAERLGADFVIRITSDCPLIDPAVCGEVLSALVADDTVGYAANNFTRRFPHGLDCEAMRRAALDLAWSQASEYHDREHVTPWLRRSPDIRRIAIDGPDADMASVRWTLDYPEDLEFFRAFMPLLGPDVVPWAEALEVFRANPELGKLNRARAQT